MNYTFLLYFKNFSREIKRNVRDGAFREANRGEIKRKIMHRLSHNERDRRTQQRIRWLHTAANGSKTISSLDDVLSVPFRRYLSPSFFSTYGCTINFE